MKSLSTKSQRKPELEPELEPELVSKVISYCPAIRRLRILY